ncbi:hypothetical protein GCM10027049_23950 [Mucilaginibacter puniceus]
MKNFTYLTIFVAFIFASKTTTAQTHPSINTTNSYQIAVGLKFGGYENGISGKYFFQENTALEAIIGFRNNHGVVLTGLYEIHQEAFNVPALKFYYGFGAHIGGVGSGTYRRFNGDTQVYTKNQILLGADGVIGLEYKIPNAPIAVSLDLNPRIELATGPFMDIAPGLGIKYTF